MTTTRGRFTILRTYQGPSTPHSYAAGFTSVTAIDEELALLANNVDLSIPGTEGRYLILVSALVARRTMLVGR